jgi:hypothetical protein
MFVLQAFLRWFKYWLTVRNFEIGNDLFVALSDGVALVVLAETLTGAPISAEFELFDAPVSKKQMAQNIDAAIAHFRDCGKPLPQINVFGMSLLSPRQRATLVVSSTDTAVFACWCVDIVNSNHSACLDLLWAVVYRFEVETLQYGDDWGIMAILTWIRLVVQPYSLVIDDFCNCFSDGMVFCALSNAYNQSTVDFYALEAVCVNVRLLLLHPCASHSQLLTDIAYHGTIAKQKDQPLDRIFVSQ